MRIRHLLLACIALALVLGGVGFVAGLLITRQADRLDVAQGQAQTASREALALLALSQDYLLHQTPRAARQWHLRQALLEQSLRGGEGLPSESMQVLQQLHATNAGLRDLFLQLEAASRRPGDEVEAAQREMLADHLVAGTQRISEGVHQVAERLAALRRANELRRRLLVRSAAVTVLIALIGLALAIDRRVLRPLRRLRITTRLVRGGDLQARCDDVGHDEFGDLARDFNAMTEALGSRSAALQDNERKLRLLTERLPALVAFVDREGRYRFCNAHYERSFGVPADAFIGRRLDEVVSTEDYAPLRPKVEAALRGEAVRFESTLQVRGRQVDFLCEYVPERDERGEVLGFHVMSLDISDRRAAERQLAESLAWKRAMLHSAAHSVTSVGPDGLIRSVNPATLSMLGYAEHELVGRCTPERFLHPEELEQRAAELAAELGRPVGRLEALWGRALQGPAEEREWNYVRKDGSRVPVSLSVSAIRDDAGGIAGYLCMAADITERRRTEEYIRHLAHHDALTQLPNRSLLGDRLDMALRRSQRSGDRVAVIALDLDHFKRINDSLGHHAGDRLLQAVAARLQSAVRPSDTVARMGGDEFVLLLDGIKDSADLDRIAGAILARLAEPVFEGGHELKVTGSLGLALHPEHGSDAATLLKHADAAMYVAKAAGRNACRVFQPAMQERGGHERLAMETALRHAIEREQLSLHYQPQLDVASGELVGLEALLRWTHPELGSVPPAEFIPLAEASSLIVPIGRWALTRACQEVAQIARRLGRPLCLAVNVSPLQFAQADLPEQVAAALRASGLPAHELELEITEGVFLLDAPRTLETLHALRALGVAVSIDDFGTGYSSLSYLTRYPVDRIKIDQSFVRKLPDDANAAAVTTAIVSLGHGLGMLVVAEGVETAAQLAHLRQRGCDRAQGYLFSRPVPLEQFVAWAERHAERLQPVALRA